MGRGRLGFRQDHGQQPWPAPGARQPLGQPAPAQVPQLLDDRDAAGLELPVHRPVNRPNGVFQVLSGVVDTDTYRSLIHFPFFATGPDGLHVIEKGSPLVQVIPFRRDAAELAAEIGAETAEDRATRERILRSTSAETGWYRTQARAKRERTPPRDA